MMQRLVWMAAMVLVPLAGQGASFDCAKASTDAEKAICADPELSKLDEQLARAYKQALQKGPKEKVQAAQRAWLKERNTNCGSYAACLQYQYYRRIAQLQGVHWSLADWQRAAGAWSTAGSDGASKQRLVIKAVNKERFDFQLSALGSADGGEIQGHGYFAPDGIAEFPTDDDNDTECSLVFVPWNKAQLQVVAMSKESCQNYYSGDFGGLFVQGAH